MSCMANGATSGYAAQLLAGSFPAQLKDGAYLQTGKVQQTAATSQSAPMPSPPSWKTEHICKQLGHGVTDWH